MRIRTRLVIAVSVALVATVAVLAAISVTPDPEPLPSLARVDSITLRGGVADATGQWSRPPCAIVTLVGCSPVEGVTDAWGRPAYTDTAWTCSFTVTNDAVLQSLWTSGGWSNIVTKAEARAVTLDGQGALVWKRN